MLVGNARTDDTLPVLNHELGIEAQNKNGVSREI